MNSMTSTRTCVDLRAELEAQLIGGGPNEDAGYCRLPAVFPGVFVDNGGASRSQRWRVACNLPFTALDGDKAERLAAALAQAATQARILNAQGRILLVPNPGFNTDVDRRLDTRPVASLLVGTEPDGYPYNAFGAQDHLRDKPAGFTWGDRGYRFEYLGEFQYLGSEVRGGRDFGLFAEVAA